MSKNKPVYKVGDKVYVIDWLKQYATSSGQHVFEWETKIPDYSSSMFFWKIIYQELTQAGKPYKRPSDRPIKERIPVYKDFLYEVMEVRYHPKAGEISTDWRTPEKPNAEVWHFTEYPIYLLASLNNSGYPNIRCYVILEEGGISYYSKADYEMRRINELKLAHKGMYTKESIELLRDTFPKELLERVYDVDDNVLFGSFYTKGKVSYTYIPGEYMKNGNPLFLHSSINYDGIGNKDLPKDAKLMTFDEFKDFCAGKKNDDDVKILVIYPESNHAGDSFFYLFDPETGECLASHLCSAPSFAIGDLHDRRTERLNLWKEKFGIKTKAVFIDRSSYKWEDVYAKNQELAKQSKK